MTILVAGHLCLDFTPEIDGAVRPEPGRLSTVGPMRVALGGSVANTGRALVALGFPVRALAAIGDDELGELASTLLVDSGFDVSAVRVLPGASTSYSIVLEHSGRDRAFWHHAGANDRFTPGEPDLSGVDVVHVGYPSLLAALAVDDGAALRAFFERARAADVTTSLDLAVVDPGSAAADVDWRAFLANVLPVTDLFSPSVDDLTSALGGGPDPVAWADRAIDAGAAIAVVSAGGAGVALAAADEARLRQAGAAIAPLVTEWAGARLRSAPQPVPRVVTTNGAGDAVTAGLLGGILAGLGPEAATRLATECAAAVIAGSAFPSPISSDPR